MSLQARGRSDVSDCDEKRILNDSTSRKQPEQDGTTPDPNSSQANLYNPLACPPDVAKAEKHGKARRVGQLSSNQTTEDICEDCGLPANNQPMPVCGSRLDLVELGPGFPLYFEYILVCSILLIFLFAVVSIYNLIANKNGQVCELFSDVEGAYKCSGGFIINYSLGNRGPMDSFKTTAILNIIFVVLGLLIAFYYRRIQSMTADEANRGIISNSDYTVIVHGIPPGETAEHIKAFFEQTVVRRKKTVKSTVVKVNLTYDITTYVELLRKHNRLNARKLKQKGSASPELEKDIESTTELIQKFQKEVSQPESRKFTGIAFVTFATEKEAKEALKTFKMTDLQRGFYKFFSCFNVNFANKYKKSLISMDRAPEPLDVYWENLGYTWWNVTKKRLLTLISTVIVIAICFGALLGISLGQGAITKISTDQTLITGLSVICSVVVMVINSFLGIFVRKITAYEKHKTYTYYFTNVASKLSYAQFFNTALVALLVQIVVKKDEGVKLWTRDSLVPKIFFVFLLNAIVPSLSYFANPFYVLRLCKRRSLRSNPKGSKLTQQEANVLFEGPPVDMAQRYANIQKTMLLTGFYASLIPVTVIFSVVGLFVTYWTDKYLLLRRHSRPNTLGKDLAEEMTDFLELFFVAFTAGSCIFERIARQEISVLNIIALIISVVVYILPQNILAECIIPNDDDAYNTKKFSEARYHFLTDYDRMNPITQAEATKQWIVDLLELSKTSEEDKKKYIDEMFSKHIPGEEQVSNTLSNYANTMPTIGQRSNMQSGGNFMGAAPAFRPGNPFAGPQFPGGPGNPFAQGHPLGQGNPFAHQNSFAQMNSPFMPQPSPFLRYPGPQAQSFQPMFQGPIASHQVAPAFNPPVLMPQPQPVPFNPAPVPMMQSVPSNFGQPSFPQPIQSFTPQPQPVQSFMPQPQPQPMPAYQQQSGNPFAGPPMITPNPLFQQQQMPMQYSPQPQPVPMQFAPQPVVMQQQQFGNPFAQGPQYPQRNQW